MAGAAGSGKGHQFLEFIRKEAAPLIETTYRAEQTNRVLVGASLGGLFALGAALKDPDFFNGYVAVSPAVVWDNGALFKLEEAFAKQNRPFKARMFISAGSLEPVQFRGPIELFEKQIGTHGYKGLELQSYTVEGTDHGTVKPESYLRGLKWVWQGASKRRGAGIDTPDTISSEANERDWKLIAWGCPLRVGSGLW
ncbi:alpha/beta hydrolase [Massilia sp. GER05]|uniref:alpha/beta hydrolase n=1 Tax=unclassified Massilia TaxID=2609279 RepID=UPI0039B050C7